MGEGEGQYIKRRLVPFGEYVPLEEFLRGLIDFFDLPMSRNIPGPKEQVPVNAGVNRLSLSICYEVVYPNLVRLSSKSNSLPFISIFFDIFSLIIFLIFFLFLDESV